MPSTKGGTGPTGPTAPDPLCGSTPLCLLASGPLSLFPACSTLSLCAGAGALSHPVPCIAVVTVLVEIAAEHSCSSAIYMTSLIFATQTHKPSAQAKRTTPTRTVQPSPHVNPRRPPAPAEVRPGGSRCGHAVVSGCRVIVGRWPGQSLSRSVAQWLQGLDPGPLGHWGIGALGHWGNGA